MTSGYSGTPLVRKLGLKPGFRALLVNTPGHYFDLLETLPEDVKVFTKAGKDIDFIHFFTTSRKDLVKRLPALKSAMAKTGMLWISWPKGSSTIEKDLNETDVRREGLATGLVDIKICAVDEDWSGLKFVYRKEDR